MSDDAPDRDGVDESWIDAAYSDEDRAVLLRYLQLSAGDEFQLAAVEVQTPVARRALLAWLRVRVPDRALVEVSLKSLPGVALLDEILERLPPPEARGERAVLVLTELEEVRGAALAPQPSLFMRLNLERDPLARGLPMTCLLLAHPVALLKLRTVAPDFCHYFSALVRRREEDDATPTMSYEAPTQRDDLSPSGWLSYAESDWPALLRAADDAVARGEYDRARDHLAEFRATRDWEAWRAEATLIEGALATETRGVDAGLEALARAGGSPSARPATDVRSRLLCADLERSRGNLDASDALAHEAHAIATATGRSDLRALMLTRHAREIANTGAVDAALDSLREARSLFLLQGRTREAWETSLVVASLQVRAGAWDAAVAICDDDLLPTAREVLRDDHLAARALEQKAVVLQLRGRLDEALQIRSGQLAVFERGGDARAAVAVHGKIADILQDRGELAEALRIRTEIQLPAHAQLGDRRERAITLGKIADVLVKLGDADEALRLRVEEVVPVFRALGELRGLAVTLGKVTDTLITYGEHSEALRLLREQVLPALTQIAARRDIAVTHARIGAILVMEGSHAEALTHLAMARQEFDSLGDVHEQISARAWLAKALWGAGNTVGALRESQAALSVAETRREPHWLSEAAREFISLLLALDRPQEADATYERVSLLLAEDGRWNALDALALVKARIDHALANPRRSTRRRR